MLAPLPRDSRLSLHGWLLELTAIALVRGTHEFASALSAAQLAIGLLEIDALLRYLAGLRMVVGASGVEA